MAILQNLEAVQNQGLLHERSQSERLRGRINIFLVILLMGFAAFFSVKFLFTQSLRLDEAQSLWQTSRSPAKIIQIISTDVHVPLYHLILHFWTLFLGNSVPVARGLSLLFFILTIPAVYILGNEAYGKRVALFGAALVSFSPFLNWYGSEIRMYSLLVLITILNEYFFLRLFKRPSTACWWGYGITALFGMYTHYFFLLVIATQAVFFLMRRKNFEPFAFKRFAIIYSLLAAQYLPWLYLVFKSGFASSEQPLIQQPTSVNLFNTFSQFFFGFQNDHTNTILVSLWPASLLFGIFALTRDRRSGDRRKIPPQTVYFLLAGFLPILVVFFVSFYKPIYISRYLIFTLPALYLFLGWVLARFHPRLSGIVRIALILAMLVTMINQTASASTPVKEDYRDAVSYLQRTAGSRDAIVLTAPFTIYPFEYYYHGSGDLQTIPAWDRYKFGAVPAFNYQNMEAQASAIQSNYQAVWLLLSYDQGYNEQVRMYFDTHFQRLVHKNFSPGLDLYEYKLQYK